MTYPTDGIHAEPLVEGNIILAKPADNKSSQPFRMQIVGMLGHSSVDTTQIYLITTGEEQAEILETLGLVS